MDFFCTLAQALFQTGIAFLSGSMALHAQGIYSFADFLTKGINLGSVKFAQRFPNRNFSHGYGRIQFMAAAFIGIVMAGGALFFLLHNVDAASSQTTHVPHPLAFFGAIMSMLASELVSRYLACVGKQHQNAAITAASVDNRMDALSSFVVLAGILGAFLGWPAADHWVAVLVALLAIWVGSRLTLHAVQGLLDVAMAEETLAEIRHHVRKVPGVLAVERCRGRRLVDTWDVTMHLIPEAEVTPAARQVISQTIRELIRRQYAGISGIHILYR